MAMSRTSARRPPESVGLHTKKATIWKLFRPLVVLVYKAKILTLGKNDTANSLENLIRIVSTILGMRPRSVDLLLLEGNPEIPTSAQVHTNGCYKNSY